MAESIHCERCGWLVADVGQALCTTCWKESPEGKAAQFRIASERRSKGLCPSCGKVALTKHERRHGYQCPDCTARDEGMGY